MNDTAQVRVTLEVRVKRDADGSLPTLYVWTDDEEELEILTSDVEAVAGKPRKEG